MPCLLNWAILTFFFNIICRNEALRVAFIHEEENISRDGKATTKEYYSKLVKADVHGKDQVSLFS